MSAVFSAPPPAPLLGPASRVIARWRRFWFEPAPTSTLGVVRIAFGLVVLAWTVSLVPDLFTFFSAKGIFAGHTNNPIEIGLLRWFPGNATVVGIFVALIVGSVCLAVGYRTRLASLVVFLGVLSFEHRNPFVFNSGDGLVRLIAFYLMLAPAGASLSLDRWRRARERFWEFPARAPWALRLIQVQLGIVYAATVWAKVRGTDWNDGTAVSYALRIADIDRIHLPVHLVMSPVLSNLATYGTLAIEASLAVLLWNRRARPWVIGLGVALHLGIDVTLMVGFFSFAIFTGYLAFVPETTMSAWLVAVRRRFEYSKFGILARWAGKTTAPVENPAYLPEDAEPVAQPSSISARIDSTAALGSEASAMGRPTTR